MLSQINFIIIIIKKFFLILFIISESSTLKLSQFLLKLP